MCVSLMADDAEHLFLCTFAICIFSSMIFLDIDNNVRYMACKYFYPVYSLSFHFLNKFFYRTKIFNFNKVQFIHFFSCMDCAFGVMFKNSSPNPSFQRFSPIFIYKCFIVLYSTLKHSILS